MSSTAPDPSYVEARRVLLDALDVLLPHRNAIVLVGAQAIYLRVGPDSLPVAATTTDSDIALDPSLLLDEPALEELMTGAGFDLASMQGTPEPGIWTTPATISGVEVPVAVDLLVPAQVAPRQGRGAFNQPHGKRAARRIRGLEAALVDNAEITVTALDESDGRSHTVNTAGVPALLVAKIHKLSDRIEDGRARRINDKDAADVVRLIGAETAADTAAVLRELREHPVAGEVTEAAIERFFELFGSRAGKGIEMATRSLRIGMPEDRVRTICLAYAEALRKQFPPR